MSTVVYSNGSKWAGDKPDSIETLLTVLGSYVLDRTFECGEPGQTFIYSDAGMTCFFGNFLELSHVFQIDTDEPELIERLTAAINANMARPNYLEQPTFEQREATKQARWAADKEKRQAERERNARATLGLEPAS